jgi:hypothetical protein
MSSDLVNRLCERARLAASEGNMTAKCDANHFTEAADRIEALEGEVERLNKAHDERLKQNTLERAATHKQFHRAEAAEARAERLRERHKEFMTLQNALERVAGERAAADARAERLRVALENIDATALDFGYYEDGARTMHQHARKALEDDKDGR